jgi:hypothetical protein
MATIKTSLQNESRDRYLTYALSVVSGRALPDVRDGLKPVQRRILYAMLQNLNLKPSSSHRKSAAVVGEVLARFHPHGDVACYEAMVRMAQDFSLRYPLVDGQGNFGSLDGDNAAAYRYTEAKLRDLALEVIGEINEETVAFRDNFDATVVEPVVLPSRVPNLLINGATGIAVGMATSIPPHNLKDTIKAIVELAKDPELTTSKLTSIIKAPDFPTGCNILNSQKELVEMYETGRGSVRMRGEWAIEEQARGKHVIVGAYHKHTWYLIRHGELLGYSQAEHLMVAAIARYHRRSLPKKRHESWQLIESRDDRRTVTSMALLLRLAAALDRRPEPMVAGLQVRAIRGIEGTPEGVGITLLPRPWRHDEPPVDLSLECWSLRSCAEVMLEATGLQLRVEGPEGVPVLQSGGSGGG